MMGTYIHPVKRNDVDPLPLHSEVAFESPLKSIEGIVAFQRGLADFIPILKSIPVVRLTADDATCAALLTIDTIFGEVPSLEYSRLADWQIVSIRTHYDPRPMLEGMRRTSAR